MSKNFPPIHGTTVLCVRRDNKVVIAADGQVTMGEHVMKHTARVDALSPLMRDLLSQS
jgi:ATP-dependent protease HslVU (ClpYQ) peptidase subunit